MRPAAPASITCRLSASSGTSVNYLPPPAATVSAITPVTVNVSGAGIAKSFSLKLYPDPGPAGLSLIAGDIGGVGQFDAAGTDARFQAITAVSADGQGNVLVATKPPWDNGNVSLRKVSSAGVVSTILDAAPGKVDGPLASATLGKVVSLATGPDGTIFVLDEYALRRIQDGVVSTLTSAVNGNPWPELSSIAEISRPGARIVADGSGGVFVMERTRVSRVSASGVVSAFAGSPDASAAMVDGQGSAATFLSLRDIAIDRDGSLYVLDSDAVRKISADARVSTLARGAPYFNAPSSLAADHAGNVLVLDDTLEPAPDAMRAMSEEDETRGVSGTPAVLKALRQVTPAGQVTTLKTGLHRMGAVRVDAVGHVLLASDADLSVLGAGNSLLAYAGKRNTTWTDIDGKGDQARLRAPYYMAADAAGALYVLEQNRTYYYMDGVRTAQGRDLGLWLRKIAPDGSVTTLSAPGVWWGKPGPGSVNLTVPNAIAIDRQGNLFISESAFDRGGLSGSTGGGSIVKITPDGMASVFAGIHYQSGSEPQADGTGTAARFSSAPVVLGFDADGRLYVDDNKKIRMITPEQVVTTVGALPAGFGADAEGNTYVRERETVVRIAANGTRTVVAGIAGRAFNHLGALPGNLYNNDTFESPDIVRTGPASFALTSKNAVLRLVLPH